MIWRRNIKKTFWNFLRDLILIILGVFIGLKANEWLQSSANKNLEVEYLERLKGDVQLSIHDNTEHISNMERYASNASLVLDDLKISRCSVEDTDKEHFAAGLYTMGKFNPPTFIKNTTDELLHTGKLGLITNSKIRAGLMKAINDVDSMVILEGQIRSRVTPHIAYIESNVQYDIRSPLDGSKSPGWSSLLFEYKNYCQDEKLKAAISATRSMLYSVIDANSKIKHSQEELLTLINTELKIKK